MIAQCLNPACEQRTVKAQRITLCLTERRTALLHLTQLLFQFIMVIGFLIADLYLLNLLFPRLPGDARGALSGIGLVAGAFLGNTLLRAAVASHPQVWGFSCPGCAYEWSEPLSGFAALAAHTEQALALARQGPTSHDLARHLLNASNYALYGEDARRARETSTEAVRLARELEDQRLLLTALNNQALALLLLKQSGAAHRLLEEALVLAREQKHWYALSSILGSLGQTHLQAGEVREALPLLRKSLRMQRALGSRLGAAWSLVAMAVILARQGESWRAARLLGAAKGLFAQTQHPVPPLLFPLGAQTETELRQTLGKEAYQIVWQEGYDLNFEEAINEALASGAET